MTVKHSFVGIEEDFYKPLITVVTYILNKK